MRPRSTPEAERLALAQRKAHQGDYAQAEAEFRQILASRPAQIEAKFGLATVLAIKMQHREAAELLRDVARKRPDHLATWINFGNTLLHLGDYDEAECAYRSAMTLRHDHFPAVYGRGCALMHLGRPDEAERCFRSAVQIQPNEPGPWMNLGTVLRQQRKLNDAVDAYRKITQINPNLSHGWSALGQTLLELGRAQESEQAFQQAIRFSPGSADSLIGLGDALAAQFMENKALECYLKAVELQPGSQNAHTKTETQLLRMAGSAEEQAMFTRLLSDRVYESPECAVPDALALLDAYSYPVTQTLDRTRTLLHEFNPETVYPGSWWAEQLSRFAPSGAGHDKVFRGISSAIYSWSPPTQEALEAIASFTAGAALHSFGAGTGYWEWLLTRHFGIQVIASDRILRHRFIEMVVEDYGTATVNEDEVVFLAWVPQGVDAVLNLLRQMRAGQKLVMLGEGPDDRGIARICATATVFRCLDSAFEPAGEIPLRYYSYIHDSVRMYRRR